MEYSLFYFIYTLSETLVKVKEKKPIHFMSYYQLELPRTQYNGRL